MGFPVDVQNFPPSIEIKAEHIAITEQPKPLPEECRDGKADSPIIGIIVLCVLGLITFGGIIAMAFAGLQVLLRELPEMIQNWRKVKDAWRDNRDRN